jgi:hypothetical protein
MRAGLGQIVRARVILPDTTGTGLGPLNANGGQRTFTLSARACSSHDACEPNR